MNRRAPIWLVVVLTTAVLIGLWYRDRPDQDAQDHGEAPVTACGSTSPCLAGTRQQGLALSLPQSVPLMRPFPVEVQVFGAAASAVTIDFRMRGMDMGVNRTQLQRAGEHRWRADVTLPVCSSGRADWLALVEAQTESGIQRARFAFNAGAE